MELEDELRQMRLATAPASLRSRVLRDALEATRTRVVPPWFAVLERHWLYPGRGPVTALVVLWLVIASLRFTTPASLLPGTMSGIHLSDDDLARIEVQRAQLFAELRRCDDDASALPPREPLQQPGVLPPRS